jgi:hypothetical protein
MGAIHNVKGIIDGDACIILQVLYMRAGDYL